MKVKTNKNKITYTFKKGEKLHLDSIYEIQAILPFEWYDQHDPVGNDDEYSKGSGDELTIKYDLTIEIKWSKQSSQPTAASSSTQEMTE